MYQYFGGILLFFLGVAICHTQPRPVFFVEATTGQRTPGDWCKSGEGAKCLGLVTGPKTHEQKMIQKMHEGSPAAHLAVYSM